MRMTGRIFGLLTAVVLGVTALCGCSVQPSVSDDTFGVYYISGDQTSLVKKKFNLNEKTVSDEIDELIHALSTDEEDDNTTCAIPYEVVVSSYVLTEKDLALHFNREYKNLESTREVLLRSAVAKTLLQLDEVESVSFFISNEPVKDASGNVVGQMTEESFLDTFGEEEEALESDTFVLYYATEDGQNLVKSERVIHYNNTMSAEAVVLTYLSKTPDSQDDVKAVLNPNVKVVSVTTKEGTCYVKLDSSFLSQSENISTNVAVYGIVNSLTELNNISKVEISIDAGKDSVMPSTDTVSGLYEPDQSLVKK